VATNPFIGTIRDGAILVGRLALTFLAMLITFVLATGISSAFLGPIGVTASPAEAPQAIPALLAVSFLNAMVLAYLILRSRWHGLKLIGAIALLHFGVETFMSQQETLLFNYVIKMPMDDFLRIVTAGALRALIFAPLAVAALGKLQSKGETAKASGPVAFTGGGWLKRLALLAVLYVCVYFLFGYYVAWQWEGLRLFYAGTTDIKPLFNQVWDTIAALPIIVPYQLVRAILWAGLALPVVHMMRGKPWEAWLGTGLLFGVLLASGVIFPNPYMPAQVRQGHFFELSSSMLVFGWITAWVWTHHTLVEQDPKAERAALRARA
jgi:hypothetical protein